MKRVGELRATRHAITAAGAHVILTTPLARHKEHAAQMVRTEFEKLGVVRYVFIGQAWMRFSKPEESFEDALKEGAANHPDCVEIVMFSGQDRD